MHPILPPLRRKILTQIIKIVLLFGALGFSLIIIMHESVSDPKVIIEQNHKTTNEGLKLLETWYLLNSNSKIKIPLDQNQLESLFQSSLNQFKNNFKKADEINNLAEIENLWKKRVHSPQKTISEENYYQMRNSLFHLIEQSQTNEAEILRHQISFSKKITFGACLIFILGLCISIYFSEKLSSSIAQPIKKITETLQNRHKFNEKLKFPTPNSLEIKVLILELNELWKHLIGLNAKSIHNLELQKKEMDAIFASLDDAVLFLNDKNKVQYFNQGLLEILGIQNPHLIEEHHWDDLSLMTDSYMQLRTFLRKESYGEVLLHFRIQEEDMIYSALKKIVTDISQNKHGTLLLLRNLTNKLPAQKLKETLELIKKGHDEIESK